MPNSEEPLTSDDITFMLYKMSTYNYTYHLTRLELDLYCCPNVVRGIRQKLLNTLKAIADKPVLCESCRCSGFPLPDTPSEKGFDVMLPHLDLPSKVTPDGCNRNGNAGSIKTDSTTEVSG